MTYSKGLKFDVGADTRQAQQAFAALDGQIAKNTKGLDVYQQRQRQANIASMSFMRIAQDAPFFMSSMNMGIMAVSNNIPMFIESMERAKTATGNWRTAILSVGKQMLTVPNLLMLGVSAITAYSIWAGNAAREQKNLNKEFDAFKQIMKFGKFADSEIDVNKGNIDTYITNIENRIAELTNKQGKDRLFGSQRSLEEAEAKRTAGAEAFFQAKEYGEEVKLLKELKEQLEEYRKKIKQVSEAWKVARGAGLGTGGILGGAGNRTHPTMGFDGGDFEDFSIEDSDGGSWRQDRLNEIVKNYERVMRERKRLFNDTFVTPAAETFSIAMNSAWDGVFGHANSLLEIFLQRFATGLIDTFAQNAASSLFSFIPGVGGLLDLIFKPSVGGAGGSIANAQYAQRINL